MDFSSTLTVLWYAIKPNLWLLILLVVLLSASLIAGRQNWRKAASKSLLLASLVLGVIAMLLAPSFTHSSLSYVLTWVDQLSLLAVGIGAAIYSWLLLRPWLTTSHQSVS